MFKNDFYSSKNNTNDSKNDLNDLKVKVFQSLRVFVNNELNNLNNGIKIIHKYLRPNGRLAVISFNSLEDEIVSSLFAQMKIEYDNNDNFDDEKFLMNKQIDNIDNFKRYWQPLTKTPIVPTEEEIKKNPYLKTAKLRVGIKIDKNKNKND
jgi:16S rRNA (cytosine1402-N4)-methyltransferase